MNELIGKYLNGYKIVKVENDPFIKGQINLWTDEVRIETFGDRSVIKFFVRDESNSAKIYQELVDKEKYELQQRIDKAIEYINKYNKVNAYKAKTDIDRLAMLINANDLLKILKGEENE